MNLLIASSPENIKYFAVMLESLYLNNCDEEIDVYVIYNQLAEIDWNPLEKQAARFGNRIHPIPVDEEKFADFPVISKRWPKLLYFKLLAAELLPQEMDRVLMLESDMIITKPLAPLYTMSFDDNCIIACRNLSEYWGSIARNHYRIKQHLLVPQSCNLFGGGVIVFNLKKVREDGIGYQTLLSLAEKLNYTWGAPEESLFCTLYCTSRKDADPWSYYLMPIYWKAKKEPLDDKNSSYGTIIHYSLCNKPWDNYVFDTECELDRIWWSYAKKTEYFKEIRERFEQRMRDRIDCVELSRTLDNVDLYYRTIIHWKLAQNSLGGDILERYLSGHGYRRVAIYGINKLQMLLCNELQNSSAVSVSFLIDSFISREKGEYRVIRADECDFLNIDAIIVAAFLHFEEIKKNLKDTACPVFSLREIIENLLPDGMEKEGVLV